MPSSAGETLRPPSSAPCHLQDVTDSPEGVKGSCDLRDLSGPIPPPNPSLGRSGRAAATTRRTRAHELGSTHAARRGVPRRSPAKSLTSRAAPIEGCCALGSVALRHTVGLPNRTYPVACVLGRATSLAAASSAGTKALISTTRAPTEIDQPLSRCSPLGPAGPGWLRSKVRVLSLIEPVGHTTRIRRKVALGSASGDRAEDLAK